MRADTAWVGDITCIKTYEGWLYLAIVLDLFSRWLVNAPDYDIRYCD
ncbi:DDE-type integrase/transposase/recombinase [Paraglaciecola psychrophila]|uniref:ISPsy26, transposase orfB n=1 Tax=Paraglaciecola psychrophila 170 TaxID=1129794 RepID=K7A591_9ALTE|nr:ISPsy26, transposase orfB [Paraglaciecola psychrophila 170]GAC36013.1 hypothetical protein GPSY_0371 [Paraglaciecola psychrophila 170]